MPSSGPKQIVMKVPGNADARRLAQALSHAVYDNQEPVLQCIGASAVNQGVKSVAIANGYVSGRGIVLGIRPGFTKIPSEEEGQGQWNDKLQRWEVNAVILRVRTE